MPAVGSAVQLMSTKEVAALLNVSQRVVEHWAQKDKIPYLRLPGGELRVPLSGLLASLSGTFDLAGAIDQIDALDLDERDIDEVAT